MRILSMAKKTQISFKLKIGKGNLSLLLALEMVRFSEKQMSVYFFETGSNYNKGMELLPTYLKNNIITSLVLCRV